MTQLVKQADREGLFTSDIINDRYQVVESEVFKGSYMIYDLVKEDIIRSKDGSCKYFDNVDTALSVVQGTSTVATKALKVKQPKVEKKAAEAKSPTEVKTKKGSANAMIIELIKTTEMSDEEISAEVLKVYPDCKTTKPYDVKYRRRKVAAGEI